MIELPDTVKQAIAEITNIEDFKAKLLTYEASPVPEELKLEAIRYLKATHPEFDDTKGAVSEKILADIKEGEADISDMGGMN